MYEKPYSPLSATWNVVKDKEKSEPLNALKDFIHENFIIHFNNVIKQNNKKFANKEISDVFDDEQIKSIINNTVEIIKEWVGFFTAISRKPTTEKEDEFFQLDLEFRHWIELVVKKIVSQELYYSTWQKTFFCIWTKKIQDNENKDKKIFIRDFIFDRILIPFIRSTRSADKNEPLIQYQNHDCLKALKLLKEDEQIIIENYYLSGITPRKKPTGLYRVQANYFKHLLRTIWTPLTLEIEKDKIRWAINQLSGDEARIAEKLKRLEVEGDIDRDLQLRGKISFAEISKKVRDNIQQAWAYDLHVHTNNSDGTEFPYDIESLRCIKNLDGVAIMDHQKVGANSLRLYVNSCITGEFGRFLVGQEIETNGSHKTGVELSGIYLHLDHKNLHKNQKKDKNSLNRLATELTTGKIIPPLEELTDTLLEQGATIVITHPFGRNYSFLENYDDRLKKLLKYLEIKNIDPEKKLIIEVFNAKNESSDLVGDHNGKARKLATHYSKDGTPQGEPFKFPISAGSDSHLGLFDMGTGYCIVKKPTNNQLGEHFVENLKGALPCKPKTYWFNSEIFKKGFTHIYNCVKKMS